MNFEVEIKNAYEFKFNTEELASIVIGLTMLLILLAMGLAYLYGKYKHKEEKLNQEISGFDFSMDQSQVDKQAQSDL